uniref:endopeptidase La n=1 Tax=Basilea psittacipulmonis TaxID=1472345 RepID=UPI001177C43C
MTTNTPLPIVALRDVIVLPHSVTTLFIGRDISINALDFAENRHEGRILLLGQKDSSVEQPSSEDLYDVACYSKILQLLRMTDGTLKVLVEGMERVKINEMIMKDASFYSQDYEFLSSVDVSSAEKIALTRVLEEQFTHYSKLYKKLPKDLVPKVRSEESLDDLCDIIASYLPMQVPEKQSILEEVRVAQRVEKLLHYLNKESEILQVDNRIRERVKAQIDKNQRDYHLNEQMKAIQKELNDGDENFEFDKLEERIKKAGMTQEAEKKALTELKKLKLMSPMSAEATVVRNYLDVLLDVPWKKKTKVNTSLQEAVRILDEDHYGLEKVKERIIEYLAVQQRVDKLKAPILCLVGPPGVGKTSLGQSIARATNRLYTRMALGGVHDEAEIRGHRRTYIGAIPGKVIANLSKVGVRNPLFLLDEIDKMGNDFRGDPAAAMLEVLDPEQNNTFQDHYLEVDFDLSEVMFVATSNSDNIPAPLMDRMEVIHLSGYTEDEKINIASKHLIPKQMVENGVSAQELTFTQEAIRHIIRFYTREAGVRGLQRAIGKICRKVVKETLLSQSAKTKKVTVTPELLEHFLGVEKYDFGMADKENAVGEVNGLAWTRVGGVLLPIEAQAVPGKGVFSFTGSLGNVMKESMQAARIVVRARADSLGISQSRIEKTDVHVHAPDGATPKDGPSAGIAITTAIVSALTGIPVRCDVGMTGEITLRGEVWPIGGLKEKLLAALAAGLKTVLIPQKNVKDLPDIPANVKEGLKIIPVSNIEEVLELALDTQGNKGKKKATSTKASSAKKASTASVKKASATKKAT